MDRHPDLVAADDVVGDGVAAGAGADGDASAQVVDQGVVVDQIATGAGSLRTQLDARAGGVVDNHRLIAVVVAQVVLDQPVGSVEIDTVVGVVQPIVAEDLVVGDGEHGGVVVAGDAAPPVV